MVSDPRRGIFIFAGEGYQLALEEKLVKGVWSKLTGTPKACTQVAVHHSPTSVHQPPKEKLVTWGTENFLLGVRLYSHQFPLQETFTVHQLLFTDRYFSPVESLTIHQNW